MVQSCKCNCSNRKPCLLACWLLWTSREIRGSTAWHSSSSDEGDTFALWCHTENISITWRTRLGRSHDFWVTFVQNSQVTWRHKLDVLSATWCLAELILLLFAIMLGAMKMILDPWAFGSTHLTILVRTGIPQNSQGITRHFIARIHWNLTVNELSILHSTHTLTWLDKFMSPD